MMGWKGEAEEDGGIAGKCVSIDKLSFTDLNAFRKGKTANN